MFCHKCGNKIADDASFCPKCGAKLIMDEVTQQPTVAPVTVSAAKPTGSATTETGEICALLKEGLSSCPKIKAVSPAPKGSAIIVKGTVYNYIANIVSGQIKLGRVLTGPFRIPLSLIVGFLAWFGAGIGWDIAEGGFYFEDHAITLTIGLLAIGLFVAALSFFGEKETNIVLPHIRKALEPRDIDTPTDEKRKRSYIITITSGIACVLAGIVILVVFVLSGNAALSNYDPVDTAIISGLDTETITLDQTYTNDAEGFSIRYPSTWVAMENAQLREYQDTDSFIGLFARNDQETEESGFEARIFVDKEYHSEPLTATSEDFLRVFSQSVGLGDVKILELEDLTWHGCPARKLVYSYTEDARSFVETRYYYTAGNDIYCVTSLSLQSYFEKYEPIFDAIMDNYTIIGGSTGQGVSSGSANDEWVTHTDIDFSFNTPDTFKAIEDEYVLKLSDGNITITSFTPAPRFVEQIVNESTAIDPFTFADGHEGHIAVHEDGVHFFCDTAIYDGTVSEAAKVLIFANSGDGDVLDANRDLILRIARSLRPAK